MQTFNRSKCWEGGAGNRENCIVCREWGLHIRKFIGKQGKIICGVRGAR